MKIKRVSRESFAVIGKQGSTQDGPGFIQRLWEDANGHFDQVSGLAKREETGDLAGVWGAMSDASLSFHPWEADFSQGLYLAGVECPLDAQAPAGWVKWILPGFDYICVEVEGEDTFREGLRYLQAQNLPLVGAVQEFTRPADGKSYLYFPVGQKSPLPG